jgi:hypothetical protein
MNSLNYIVANVEQTIDLNLTQCVSVISNQYCANSYFTNPSNAIVLSYNCVQSDWGGGYIHENIKFTTPGVYTVTAYSSFTVPWSAPNATCTVSIEVLAIAPMVTTTSTSNLTQTSVDVSGNVTSDGGATVSSRGFCYSTSPNPTIANSTLNVGSGTGAFNGTIIGLTSNTSYYVRAFATNSIGTSYGSELSFTTVSIPQLTCNYCGPAGGQDLTSPLMVNGIIYASVNQSIPMTSYKCSNSQNMSCSNSGFVNPPQANVISYSCTGGTGQSISQEIFFSSPGVYSVTGFAGSSIAQKTCTVHIVVGP